MQLCFIIHKHCSYITLYYIIASCNVTSYQAMLYLGNVNVTRVLQMSRVNRLCLIPTRRTLAERYTAPVNGSKLAYLVRITILLATFC